MKNKFNTIALLSYALHNHCGCDPGSGGAAGNGSTYYGRYGNGTVGNGDIIAGNGGMTNNGSACNNNVPVRTTLVAPQGTSGYLRDFHPQPIGSLRFTTTLGEGVDTAYIDDFTNIANQRGDTPGATTQAFTMANGLNLTNFKNWLATTALFVCGYNLSSSVPEDINNDLELRDYNINNTYIPTLISNNQFVNAFNNQNNLVNAGCGFVMKRNTALFVRGTAGVGEVAGSTLSLTLKIADSDAYNSRPWSTYCLPICGSGCSF